MVQLKEESLYTKPPLNEESTPAKLKSDILTEIDLRDETNNLEPRIRRPIIFNIPNKSKDVNEQDRKENLKGNLDITSSTEPMFAKSIRPMMMPKENLPHYLGII